MLKNLQLAVRDVINDITGQTPKIDRYHAILDTLAAACSEIEDAHLQGQIMDDYSHLSELTCGSNPDGTYFIDSFNAYKPGQNKQLSQKIKQGNQLLKKYNLA